MGADGSKVTDSAVGALTVVVAEPVGSPPRPPQPQTSPDERPTQKAATATIEQTGADPPPKG
jgi:hypothetical protein